MFNVKPFFCAIFLISFFFVFASECLAVSLEISGVPETLNEEEEFPLSVNVQGSKSIANKNYYLEAVFTKKDQNPSYFGWTKNERDQWHNHGSNFSDFYKITMSSEASWSGVLKVKPDLTDNSFKGSGDYWLKVFRYTEGGSKGNDDCNQLLVFINHQEPSPSPSPSPSPESSPSPSPDASPSPSPSPVISPSPTPTVLGAQEKKEKKKLDLSKETANSEEILGVKEAVKKEQKEEIIEKARSLGKLPFVFIGGGLVLLFVANFPALKPKLQDLLELIKYKTGRKEV